MIITALQLVARRSVAHMKLLSAVIGGVVLAVAIMAATFIYFDSLRNLALRHAVDGQPPQTLDVVLQLTSSSAQRGVHDALVGEVEGAINANLGQFLSDRFLGIRSATFDFEPIAAVTAPEEGERRRVAFVALPGVEDQVDLVAGAFPVSSTLIPGGGTLRPQVMIPVSVADRFGYKIGDTFRALPFWDEKNSPPEPVIAGIFERRQPEALFWRVYDDLFALDSPNFTFVAALVPADTFVDGLGAYLPNMTASYGWNLDVDPALIDAQRAGAAVTGLGVMQATLKADSDSYRQITGLGSVLSDFETRLFFNRLPMIIVLVLVVLVVLYYAVTLASLLVDAQREEISTLRTRGASGRQIIGVFVIEAGALSVMAVAIGPFVAAAAVKYAGIVPWFDGLNGGDPLPVSLGWDAYRLAILGGVLSFGALFIPAVRASRVGLLTQRARSGRHSGPPAFQRYYLDLVGLGVVVVLLSQLQSRGSVAAENLAGENTVDQITLAIPALFLIAAGLVLLRLFPVMMEMLARLFSSRLLYRIVTPTLVLGLWTMARNPAHYSRLSLLFILTAGLGVFAANFSATLDRSAGEQVLYESGAGVRVINLSARPGRPSTAVIDRIAKVEGVATVSPVLRKDGVVNRALGVDEYQMLAVDPDTFAEVAWTRSDFFPGSIASRLDLVRTETERGVPLPDDTRWISMRIRPAESMPDALVLMGLRDANGRYYLGSLGNLAPEPSANGLFTCEEPAEPEDPPGWCTIGGSAERIELIGIRTNIQPVQPLTLLSITVGALRTRRTGLQAGSVLIDEISAVKSDGTSIVVESFDGPDTLKRWQGSPLLPAADAEDRLIPGVVTLSWAGGEAFRGAAVYRGDPPAPIPVLASSEFLDRYGRAVGDVMEASQDNADLSLRLVGEVKFFPTVDPNSDPFLVAGLDAVLADSNRFGAFRVDTQFNELWIETDGADTSLVAERVAAELDRLPYTYTDVVDRDGEVAGLSVDPLVRAGWKALLALAFATVLLVSGVGFLVHSQVTFQARRTEFALLRTIGLSMKQLLSLVVFEQVLVLGVAVGIGIFMGTRLGATMLPFLSNSGEGVRVVPPIIVEVDWLAFGLVFAVLAAVVVFVMGTVLLTVYRMSIQSVLRLGER